MASGIIVDADSHIMEPATLWQKYMDPEFRSRALRISVDEFGLSIWTSMARSASDTTAGPSAGSQASTSLVIG